MKAATEAWGLKANEFKRGFAKETHDPAIVAATMAKPGIVLRRPVGSNGPFSEHAELPKDAHRQDQGEASKGARRKAKETGVDDTATLLLRSRESRRGARARVRRKRPHGRRSANGASRQSQRRKERLRQPNWSTKSKRKKSKPTALHLTDGRRPEDARWEKQKEKLEILKQCGLASV
jgi:colicin import membrane protein